MPQIRYITSDSQMIAPGVYIKENAPASPVRGQRTRRAGFAGQCVRGPTGKAVLCDSYGRFLDVFGARDKNTSGGTILGHVWKALQGKYWGAIYVVRVAAAAAVKASFTLETAAGGGGTAVLRVDASSVGTWGNDVGWKVLAATNGDANAFNLSIRLYGKLYLFENIKITTGFDNTNVVIGTDDATLIRLAKLADGRPNNSTPSTDGADTDGYTLLGQTVAGYTSVLGTDGVIADSDYTVAGGPIDTLNGTIGVHACAVVGRSNTAVKTAIATAAASASQKVWFACPDSETVTQSTAITERATFNTQRMSYWFNHDYITDPITREEIVEEPFLFPMSVITQTDPDVHVGDFDNANLYAACRRVYNALTDPNRDAMTTGGLSWMQQDFDASGNLVNIAGNAVTCDFAVNNRDLDARYMKDFLLDAIGQRLKGDQFKGNSRKNRANRAGACSSFLNALAKSQRYVNTLEDGTPQYQYVNDATVNSSADQAQGIQKELMIVQLIPKNKIIELQATIGVDAKISEQS